MKQLYLSGSIEYSKDAYTWRNELKNKLKDLYNVKIPKANVSDLLKFNKSSRKYKKWIYENFILPDIYDILFSNYIFVKIDRGVLHGAGTLSEVTVAAFEKKNIVYMLSDGLQEKDLPGWLLGCLYHARKVKGLDQAVKYYRSIK